MVDVGIGREIEEALGGRTEEVSDLVVAGVPKMAVVARILHQHFMRADGMHPVVKPVTAATRPALNGAKRSGMHHGTTRPSRSLGAFDRYYELRRCRKNRATQTTAVTTRRAVDRVNPP